MDVENKLRDDVKRTLEVLHNSSIWIRMVTGDEVETVRCIAVSTKQVARNRYIQEPSKCKHLPPLASAHPD
jgi:phospholipid-translocating ATPase